MQANEQTTELTIENDNLREDIAARDAQINTLQRRLRYPLPPELVSTQEE